MHPGPDEVRAWFAQAVTAHQLARYVGLLRAAPHWHVASSVQRRACLLVLFHRPTGEDVDILLQRDDPAGVWHPQPL